MQVGSAAPVDLWQVDANSWVYDFGVNRAAVTTLSVDAPTAQALGAGAVWTQQAAEASARDDTMPPGG